MEQVRGYKAFNKDWTCKGKQYEVGKMFEEDVELEVGAKGMHFCKRLSDCFNYYTYDESVTKVAEVLAVGDCLGKDDLIVTNKLVILRELQWDEVINLCNTGDWNTGNWNTGNKNTGNKNTGDRNTGDWNTGDRNTGCCNTGNWNTGCWNTGDSNTGNWNTGDWNAGDWNTTSYSSGCFNTTEGTIRMFNKPSDMSMEDWLVSDSRAILNRCPCVTTKWINSAEMTDAEKADHPEHTTTGGFLKTIIVSDAEKQEWWDGLEERERKYVKALPNFDKAIFYECTGIEV